MTPLSWVGKTIGDRYRVESLLGQGGMSAVYRASDPNLRRLVAIKLIHPHLSTDPNFVQRFKEEAAAVARLRHSNIVQVHDFDVDNEVYYMVMEYLVGETLRARLERLNADHRVMPLNEAVQICGQLCDALGYAHNHELIHRDVKPANIMLDLEKRAVLMDFGIVKIVGGDTHTATGATVGTARYMSPEQIRSERTDERSDIYSLGVTLYEMISGRPPFQADSALPLMMMVLNDPLPDLREVRKGIPQNLYAVVQKALAKDKADRFQEMGEMAAALGRISSQELSAAPPATVVDSQGSEPPQETTGAEPTMTAEERPSDPAPTDEAPAIREPEVTGKKTGPSAVPTLVDPAPEAAPSVPTASGSTLPTPAEHPSRPRWRRLFMVAAIVLLLAAAVAAAMVAVTSRRAPTVQITPVEQPSELITPQTVQYLVSLASWETSAFLEDLAFSPDGKLVGMASNRESERFSRYRFYGSLWRLDSSVSGKYLLGHSELVYSLAFSPDGQFLATASDDDTVIVWKVSDGSLVRTLDTSMGGMVSVAFSPNNLLLAAGSWDGSVGLWQVDDGQLLRTLSGHEEGAKDVQFSPDGTLLASASEDRTIRIWQVSDGSLVHTLRGHNGPVHRLAFSPDGTLLASGSADRTIKLWRVRDGSHAQTLQGHSDLVLDVAFSPDGTLLASGSGDQTTRLWQVSDGDMLRIIIGQEDYITVVVFSPDGRLLVSGSAAGTILFWGLSEAIPTDIQ